jgi:glyoxylase-like metal-dependent hydrolase (beta-lactamase superfamily II)
MGGATALGDSVSEESIFRPGAELGARLTARGVAPDRIDDPINSHLHFDHSEVTLSCAMRK